MNESKKRAIIIAKKEIKKQNKERAIHYLLSSVLLISSFLLLTVLTIHLLEINGFSTYVSNPAGYITELDVHSTKPVYSWGGFYGLVLRVPDFTEQLYEELESGEIRRSDIFFDCVKTDAQGGPEVYASINESINLESSTITPATMGMINSFISCTSEIYCAEDTFTRNMTIYLGSTNITNIPSTFTYKYNGDNQIFDVGALNVSGNLVFVAHINTSIQKGFNENTIVNYQLLLPTPENTTQRYYFYTDPFDTCPAGGIGSTLNLSVFGNVTNSSNSLVPNVTVSFAGQSVTSNENGTYNLSALVLEGDYKIVAIKESYDTYVDTLEVNFSITYIQKNIALEAAAVSEGNNSLMTVYGRIQDSGEDPIDNATIIFGNARSYSNSTGNYNISSDLASGENPLVVIKEDYDTYYSLLNFSNSSNINHNITLDAANLNDYPTGPYTQDNTDDEEGDATETAKSKAEELGQDYWVSTSEINKQVRENTFVEDSLDIYNFKSDNINIIYTVSPELTELLRLTSTSIQISPDGKGQNKFTIYGTKPIGIYRGKITISGDITQEIPVKIEILPKKFSVQTISLDVDLHDSNIDEKEKLRYKINIENLISDNSYQISLKHLILDKNGVKEYISNTEVVEIKNNLDLIREIDLENITEGEYVLSVEAKYNDLFSSSNSPFKVSKKFYLYSFFGVPLWIIFSGIFFLSFVLFNFFVIQRRIQKNKRYHVALDPATLPKPGERSVKLGKLAERNIPAFYNLDDLTTHAIVAGATGGGKSIAAQVFVEEALLKNTAVIVFDPTAQWSGMLRKCDDKKMMSFYPKFGLKPSDAKAFPGSVRQVTNEKQSINVNKYVSPGHIQVFTMNKLTPQQIDIFVAGVISNIFKSDPKEYPNLKVLLVFDEVHRLLPKFGGSGKGFLQIERACREFRKWGLGVMLVSQVLSDFVGEIKANINTEVQMRVAEENDLQRIKERYGEEALKSLVRSDVGTGMIQNAEYNKGLPYFVNLRPILHNTRRLTDDVLEKYNKYNDLIDDIEYQIEQLEKEKFDTFDLKMELKLIKDKLMSGNFTVVDIYLEGLVPKLEKIWTGLNKKPAKKEIELINVEELESALLKAKQDRNKWETENKKDEKQEVKEENKLEKIVVPITFNNGIMVSSFKELREVLPTFDKAVFKEHVNDNKNEIASWASQQIDLALGEKLSQTKTLEDMTKAIEDYFKEQQKKKEESAKENKKEEKSEDKK